MAEISTPWDLPPAGAELVGDQARDGSMFQGAWRRMMRSFGDGVIRDSGTDALKVFASSTERRVGVTPGEALVQGALYQGTASTTGGSSTWSEAIPTGTGPFRILLRYDPAAKTVRCAFRGSLTLTRQEDGIWEMPLATIRPPASGIIPQDAITDDRLDTTSNYWREVLTERVALGQQAYIGSVARHRPDSTRQVNPSGSFGPVALHTASGPTGSQRGGEPTRIYATRRGNHDIRSLMHWQSPSGVAAAGIRDAAIYVNGSAVTPAFPGAIRGSGEALANVDAGPVFLNVGDYVELHQRHGQDRALGIATSTWLSIAFLGGG